MKPSSVAQDRYRKQISMLMRSGRWGSMHGVRLQGRDWGWACDVVGGRVQRRRGRERARVSLAQAATRAVTATTTDAFGDRSTAGKVADQIPAYAISGTALLAGRQKSRKKWVGLRRSMKAASSGEQGCFECGERLRGRCGAGGVDGLSSRVGSLT